MSNKVFKLEITQEEGGPLIVKESNKGFSKLEVIALLEIVKNEVLEKSGYKDQN